MSVKKFFKALIRRKQLDFGALTDTNLNRCLSTLDLTALGIGSTLGLGIYVLAGQVASTKAGPAVTLSFFIAAVASVFAGLSYAEFGARVPKTGSAYVYSYVTVGEFMAFVIGWNLILEYVIGTASVARGYSGYIDSLTNGTIERTLIELLPINNTGISAYPDFLALGITLLLTVMLAVGVKESSRFNNVFTVLNLAVVLFAVIAGGFKADITNWKLSKEEVPDDAGEGGFFPFGFSGMMQGAATCFYGFIGFDVIATTGEEVKNPQRAIPISIVLSLLFIFFAYFGVSSVQTLMWPYWDQDQAAPLPYVFQMVGLPWARWVIAIGALAGLSTSLLGAMFPLPRIFYAMASDGVIFRTLAKINPRLKTPLLATGVSGVLSGVMAMMFDIKELADMMSIGTLLAYSLVALSVLILRYQKDPTDSNEMSTDTNAHQKEKSATFEQVLRQFINLNRIDKPTALSSRISLGLILSTGVVIVILDSLLITYENDIINQKVKSITIVACVAFCGILPIFALWNQPSNQKKVSFKVPLVPFLPFLSIFVNIYLMFKLSKITWIRFAVWMSIGLVIYFGYGIWNSNERTRAHRSSVSKACSTAQLQNSFESWREDVDSGSSVRQEMEIPKIEQENVSKL
ncbi:cationic amino acid transporter 2-like [Limulus polyphemus]|uniref:Cationic amino acid transporter 2-like n=1 Tax=Limulus polyphemus TaxID=6850 RepID=A0ABM1B2R5_LIMPO|nr:cationic amino acid transporter 2-like [Limulus polyphemus]XP_022240609.1 cationic amino acid transporter 2-like [Limulus polyphemus]XP_022240610.1 cationic amino acid transporter 2-like [Limulus polyphemus]XP_022240611.1 cationic amino acid transporter 2-like [Limulus polyphemus]XP_022240612.1 cationic amino acid transporter 2-like [Limulus polyphemus]